MSVYELGLVRGLSLWLKWSFLLIWYYICPICDDPVSAGCWFSPETYLNHITWFCPTPEELQYCENSPSILILSKQLIKLSSEFIRAQNMLTFVCFLNYNEKFLLFIFHWSKDIPYPYTYIYISGWWVG